ncbi:ATP synthase subunit I [Lichenifustis flavocetrariae]|uniref:ATP synthase subunit I n=1 Tax=Lichenifustis flavocetrariae TaxID=2949735 RepID=A0AA42CN11_9HYPH|nr:ATP synthase subunit I [Lichenifustis flavocetrariae]MCW6512181.1 ATP synthase subunit I [Lichenifustis flavocetrariae]
MSAWSFHGWSSWFIALSLAFHCAMGLVLGGLHFGGLWWNTRLFADGGRLTLAMAAMLGRIVVLGGVLTLVSFEGAPPLLATATGVLLARAVVTRRTRRRTW